MQEVTRIAARNAIVHGGLMITMGAVLVGLLALSARLGWHSNRVRTAVVFHATGFAFMLAAATVNGFVITHIAANNVDAADEELKALAPVLGTLFNVNQVCAMWGIVALTFAIAAWSAALLGRGRGARAVAIFGFVIAALPVLMHLVHHGHVDAHVMMALVVLHGLWYAAAAVWLSLLAEDPHDRGNDTARLLGLRRLLGDLGSGLRRDLDRLGLARGRRLLDGSGLRGGSG
jgi:hypothetical protein